MQGKEISPIIASDLATHPQAPLERLAFIHLPKTGGTSLADALKEYWKSVRVIDGVFDIENVTVQTATCYNLIAGHFHAYQLDEPLFKEFVPITVLRDPFERLLSSYHFIKRSILLGAPTDASSSFVLKSSFFDYAVRIASDRHGQLILLGLNRFEDATFVSLQDLLDRASRRLEGMHVGVTNMLEPFLISLLREAGIGETPGLKRLLAAETPYEDGLTRAQGAALRELMAPDYILHERATALAVARLERFGDSYINGSVTAPEQVRASGGTSSTASSTFSKTRTTAGFVERLKAMPGPITTLQKVCDAADWSDPRLLVVIREGFKLAPRINPRQWEFAAAYLALAHSDMLDGNAQWLTFGSGQEPLIFAVAPRVKRLTVTDLYTMDSNWDIARTKSPRDFVLQAAPPGFDPSPLDVRSMDMRRVDFPDETFDFCYSISAFEHIGVDADFISHLSEVRRILRPGGVYAMTTEVRLAYHSSPTPGNTCFSIGHLLRLFAEAGLHPEPRLDMRMSDFGENEPRDLPGMRHYDAAEGFGMTLVVREFGGIMSVPVLFLLRKELRGSVEVIGLEETILRAEQALQLRTKVRGTDWMRLHPWAFFGTQRNPHYDLYSGPAAPPDESLSVFATGYQAFGDGEIEVQVVLAPSPHDSSPADIAVVIMRWEREAAERLGPCFTRTASVNKPTPGMASTIRFRLPVEASCRYSIIGQRLSGRGLLSTVDVQVRHAP